MRATRRYPAFAALSLPFTTALTTCENPSRPADPGAALFADIRHADWLPDGSGFVVTRATADGGDIVVMDRDGNVVHVVAETPAAELTADPSPDGQRIAYAAIEEGGAYSVWISDSDGGNARSIPPSGFATIFPQWSPDGRRLAFNSVGGDGLRRVFVAEADGSDPRALTGPDDGGHSDYPSWSPDGAWVLFESDRSGSWETYRIRPDGADLQQLTDQGSSAPRYAPDGRTIAIHDVRNGTDFDILLVDAVDGGERVLAGGPGDQRLPEWSPDGSTIAFISNADGHHDLFEVDVSSGEVAQVTHQPEGELFGVLRLEGPTAARARFDAARAADPPPLIFRDVRIVAQHVEWAADRGDLERARFLLELGLEVFPEAEELRSLRDRVDS